MFLNSAFTRSSSSAPNESGDFGVPSPAEAADLAAKDDRCAITVRAIAQAAITTARTLISHPVAIGTGRKMQAISY